MPEAVNREALHYGMDVHGRTVRDPQVRVLVWVLDGIERCDNVRVCFTPARGAVIVAAVALGPRLAVLCDIWKRI